MDNRFAQKETWTLTQPVTASWVHPWGEEEPVDLTAGTEFEYLYGESYQQDENTLIHAILVEGEEGKEFAIISSNLELTEFASRQ